MSSHAQSLFGHGLYADRPTERRRDCGTDGPKKGGGEEKERPRERREREKIERVWRGGDREEKKGDRTRKGRRKEG